ncbi:unnamed protein product [Phytophthora fragariaefolia]|uniref:Unnamed protein product n=1 Tax=Phytophthora fragariaefolia TaxID=1490495 RepID=A0A9W6XVY3_9STRA|nr:unnamed protein product [Phytophthora fragariaefolia]
MTEKAYRRLPQCVEDAVGTKLVPKDVVPTCDFEGALINAMGTFFPTIRIIDCLYHFKQACRRESKKYGLPNAEAGLAMAAAVFDVLTVTNPEKIALEGGAWVKRNHDKFCREYVAQRRAVIAGLAQPPTRTRFVLPRAATFPNENDIENSEYSSDSDDDAENVDSDAYSEISSAHDDNEDMEAENLIETIRSNMRLSDRARI